MMQSMTGKYKWAYHWHITQDFGRLMQSLELAPGKNLLDLGTGNAELLRRAMAQVGDGVCVGVDTCTQLLDVDATHCLQAAGYTVNREPGLAARAPGTATLLAGDFLHLDEAFKSQVLSCLPDGRSGFDIINLFIVLGNIPLCMQPRMLERLVSYFLAPGGQIVFNISLYVDNTDDAPPVPARAVFQSPHKVTGWWNGAVETMWVTRACYTVRGAPDYLWVRLRDDVLKPLAESSGLKVGRVVFEHQAPPIGMSNDTHADETAHIAASIRAVTASRLGLDRNALTNEQIPTDFAAEGMWEWLEHYREEYTEETNGRGVIEYDPVSLIAVCTRDQ